MRGTADVSVLDLAPELACMGEKGIHNIEEHQNEVHRDKYEREIEVNRAKGGRKCGEQEMQRMRRERDLLD